MEAVTLDETGQAMCLQREGMQWLALMISGRATDEDLAEMERWKHQSPAHAEALAAAIQMRRLVAAQDKFSGQPPFLYHPATRRFALGGAVAAAAVYSVTRPPLALWPSLSELGADYRTGTGEQRQIALARGVSVAMNTRTSLSLRSGPGQPGIELVTGEIAMTTQLPEAAPFTVYAGKAQIVASDANFDLRNDDGRICVSCLEGRLAIRAGNVLRQLGPSEQLQFAGNTIEEPVKVDPVVLTAWRHGLLIFHDASLRSIVAEINRYRSGKIVVMNAALANRRFNGQFKIAHIDNAVAELAHLSNASTAALPGGIVLLT
jgi:transmembrane sensor